MSSPPYYPHSQGIPSAAQPAYTHGVISPDTQLGHTVHSVRASVPAETFGADNSLSHQLNSMPPVRSHQPTALSVVIAPPAAYAQPGSASESSSLSSSASSSVEIPRRASDLQRLFKPAPLAPQPQPIHSIEPVRIQPQHLTRQSPQSGSGSSHLTSEFAAASPGSAAAAVAAASSGSIQPHHHGAAGNTPPTPPLNMFAFPHVHENHARPPVASAQIPIDTYRHRHRMDQTSAPFSHTPMVHSAIRPGVSYQTVSRAVAHEEPMILPTWAMGADIPSSNPSVSTSAPSVPPPRPSFATRERDREVERMAEAQGMSEGDWEVLMHQIVWEDRQRTERNERSRRVQREVAAQLGREEMEEEQMQAHAAAQRSDTLRGHVDLPVRPAPHARSQELQARLLALDRIRVGEPSLSTSVSDPAHAQGARDRSEQWAHIFPLWTGNTDMATPSSSLFPAPGDEWRATSTNNWSSPFPSASPSTSTSTSARLGRFASGEPTSRDIRSRPNAMRQHPSFSSDSNSTSSYSPPASAASTSLSSERPDARPSALSETLRLHHDVQAALSRRASDDPEAPQSPTSSLRRHREITSNEPPRTRQRVDGPGFYPSRVVLPSVPRLGAGASFEETDLMTDDEDLSDSDGSIGSSVGVGADSTSTSIAASSSNADADATTSANGIGIRSMSGTARHPLSQFLLHSLPTETPSQHEAHEAHEAQRERERETIAELWGEFEQPTMFPWPYRGGRGLQHHHARSPAAAILSAAAIASSRGTPPFTMATPLGRVLVSGREVTVLDEPGSVSAAASATTPAAAAALGASVNLGIPSHSRHAGISPISPQPLFTPEMSQEERIKKVRGLAHTLRFWPSRARRVAAESTLRRINWGQMESGDSGELGDGACQMTRDTACSICQEDYEDESQVVITPCKHMYHRHCLEVGFEFSPSDC